MINLKKILFENISHKQTILKNTFWLGAAEFLSKGMYLLVFIWLANHFGPRVYGQWNFALSFVSFFAVFVEFGFKIFTIQEIARNKEKSSELLNNILAIKAILGFFVILFSYIISRFLTGDEDVLRLILLLSAYIVIDNLAVFVQAIFRAYEKMELEAFSRILQSFLLFLLCAFFIFGGGSIVIISYAFIFSSFAGFMVSFLILNYLFPVFSAKISVRTWKSLFLKVWPFLFSGIFYMLYYETSSIMLGLFSTMENVGYFNAAYNLFIAVFVIPEIITMSFFPKLSFSYSENKKDFKRQFDFFKKTMFVTGLLVTVFLFAASGLVMKIYSDKYSESISILKVLSLIIIFKFLSHAYTWFLVSADEQKKNFKIQGVAALLNIMLSFIFIIKFGVMGAAYATVVTELFLLSAYFAFYRLKLYKINLALN